MRFILVHTTNDDSSVWLRADSIEAIIPKENGTLLFTSQIQVLKVKESVNTVLDAIRRTEHDD